MQGSKQSWHEGVTGSAEAWFALSVVGADLLDNTRVLFSAGLGA